MDGEGCGHMASRAGSSTAPKLRHSAGGSRLGLEESFKSIPVWWEQGNNRLIVISTSFSRMLRESILIRSGSDSPLFYAVKIILIYYLFGEACVINVTRLDKFRNYVRNTLCLWLCY